MKRKIVWPWIVFAVLGASLLLPGCALFGNVPPPDEWTVLENGTMIQQPDGKLDPQFIGHLNAVKGGIDVATGGATSLWTTLGVSIITTLSGVAVALLKDKKDKAEVMKEIALTDKNVATVAKAASVPDHDIE